MRVLAVDERDLYLDNLRSVLGESGSELVGVGGRKWQVTDAIVATSNVDAIVVDAISVRSVCGWGLARLREGYPGLPIVIVSTGPSPAEMSLALQAGATAVLSRSKDPRALVSALQLATASSEPSRGASAVTRGRRRRQRTGTLTRRQEEVARLLTQGLTNQQMAGQLGIAMGTVKAHVAAILTALGAENRTAAVSRLRDLGYAD